MAAKAAVLSKLPQGDRAGFITVDEIGEYLMFDAAAPITGTAISIDVGTIAGQHDMEGDNPISTSDR